MRLLHVVAATFFINAGLAAAALASPLLLTLSGTTAAYKGAPVDIPEFQTLLPLGAPVSASIRFDGGIQPYYSTFPATGTVTVGNVVLPVTGGSVGGPVGGYDTSRTFFYFDLAGPVLPNAIPGLDPGVLSLAVGASYPDALQPYSEQLSDSFFVGSFTNSPNNSGAYYLYVDLTARDISFSAIPEPMSAIVVVLSLVGLGFTHGRQRR